jgi:hypothetical protein
MSIPISELPDADEIETKSPKLNTSRITNHIDLIYIALAVIATSYVSIDAFRHSVPHQLFALGDAPIIALITVIIFVMLRLVVRNIVM